MIIRKSYSRATKAEAIKDKVLEVVAERTGISIEDIQMRSRKHEKVRARQIASYVYVRIFGVPLQIVGEYLGGYDHSTVIHSVKAVEDYLFLKHSVDYQITKDILDNIFILEAKKSA